MHGGIGWLLLDTLLAASERVLEQLDLGPAGT